MRNMRVWLIMACAFAPVLLMAWASDHISLQGERTVYTVGCRNGGWQGTRCGGTLVAADRFRFRALPARKEVLFWIVASPEPPGKFTDCVIRDGRDWTCDPNADSSRAIAQGMSRGFPVPGKTGVNRPFHSVPKWKWHLIRLGVWRGTEVDN